MRSTGLQSELLKGQRTEIFAMALTLTAGPAAAAPSHRTASCKAFGTKLIIQPRQQFPLFPRAACVERKRKIFQVGDSKWPWENASKMLFHLSLVICPLCRDLSVSAQQFLGLSEIILANPMKSPCLFVKSSMFCTQIASMCPPPVVSRFINPSKYSYKYHKP